MSYGQTPTIKRVRGKNFTDNERDEVLKIIDKYKNIIDNKKTDAETIRLKNAAWQEVTEEFNSILPMSRTPSQLRVFYENYKVKLRKELVEQGLKTDADEVSIKRMKLTDSEEKLIVKYQKPMPSNSHVEYIDRYNNIEAGTSNTLHYGRDKVFFDNNSQSFYPEPTVTNNYSNNMSGQLDEDDDCSSEPLKLVTEVDPIEDSRYNIPESNSKSLETVKPSQAYAAIVESNKANCRLKTKKSEYIDDYNRLKIELVHSELKLKNKEYENILLSAAMEHKMNAVKLKILECELEIKQEQLKKEKEKNK